jgi:hypothetical protein
VPTVTFCVAKYGTPRLLVIIGMLQAILMRF